MEQKPKSYVNQGLLLCCKFAEKKIYNTNVDLVNDNGYTKFSLNLFIYSLNMEKKQILTSIKGRNSVVNLREKTMIYNNKVDLINDNV